MKTFTKSISKTIGIFVAIIFMLANLSIAQSPNSKDRGGKLDIDTFIAGQMEAFHVPGLSACIIVGDEVVWNNNYGYMNLEDSIPVNDNTLFNAFSISKSLTAVCVMQQWENGNLDIDSDINNYLPFDVINPNYPDVNITSQMLLCHTSSLSDLNLMNFGTIGDPTSSLAFFCENYFPEEGQYYNAGNYYNQSPGLYFHYSNLGVGLNGYLVEAISGNEFHEYANENLLSPLNMGQSAWFLDELNMENLAIGYDYASGNFTPNNHMGHPCYPGLSLRSTALELGQFVIMMLNEGQYQGNEILQSSTIDTMLTVQNPNWGFSYGTTGLGVFMRTDYGNRTVWGHNGTSGGYAAHYYFCPDENTGIVIMTNSNQYVDPIVEYMLDYAYELANTPVVPQIQFQGLYSQGEGFASWNADGSGPEPAATGHINPNTGTASTYYAASYDYITENPDHAGFHMMPGMTGFSTFEQALSSNGFATEQVKVKFGLGSYEEDIEGLDWMIMGAEYYCNHYNLPMTIELEGEIIFKGHMSYINHQRTGSANYWYLNSSYTNLLAVASSSVGQDIAAAFLEDLNGQEIVLTMEMTVEGVISTNGRSGYGFNLINGVISVGNPTLPLKGLHTDHEGSAAWDADGTGPEPYGNGHQNMLYYCASVDYDDINPSPDACLAHFLEGSTGFFNTLLQMQYRAYDIGELKVKMGLASFGPDVMGEDWGVENGHHWVHEYNNVFTFEINGEPILYLMQDTMKMVSFNTYWDLNTSVGKVYDISQNASTNAQFVAQSFLKDLGTHYLEFSVYDLNLAGSFSGNGRSGAYYQISDGALTGVHEQATFIPEGLVSGTWTAENSPYYVDGHLTVENGETLTIEPGVKVAVRGPYHFEVQGCVKAEGTAEENIVFTRSNPNFWWDGIDYNGNMSAVIMPSVYDHCIFEYGYAQRSGAEFNSGGAMAILDHDSVSVKNSIFRYNKANIAGAYPPSGGAIVLDNSDLFIQKCIFYGNHAEYGGAIMVFDHSNPIISNCLFYENWAENGGAIAFHSHSGGVVMNNTFADNFAELYGGAFYFYSDSDPEIINTILWGNAADGSGNQVYGSVPYSSPGFYYCDIEEGQAGFGGQIGGDYHFNIEDDPMFSGDEVNPYSLLNNSSSCWNAGTPDTSALFIAYNQYLPETCLCDSTRIADGCIDIGAYEYPLILGINKLVLSSGEVFSTYPNPFHENLTISFELENTAMVVVEIYNVVGEKVGVVNNTKLQSGMYSINWYSPSLPEGIYFCRMQLGGEVFTQKIVKR